jgi:hypothetical protein
MKLVESRSGAFLSYGLAALAIVTALIDTLPVGEQRGVLIEATTLLTTSPGMNRDETRRMASAMLAQLGSTRPAPTTAKEMNAELGKTIRLSRPHRWSGQTAATRRQASATYPLTPRSRRMSVMVASFCIACPPAKYCRAVGRCAASVDLGTSATDPVPSVLTVEIRPTFQAAPHRLLTALIVKLKRTVNVVFVSHNALAFGLEGRHIILATSPGTSSGQSRRGATWPESPRPCS